MVKQAKKKSHFDIMHELIKKALEEEKQKALAAGYTREDIASWEDIGNVFADQVIQGLEEKKPLPKLMYLEEDQSVTIVNQDSTLETINQLQMKKRRKKRK